jgi:hypothetical protein
MCVFHIPWICCGVTTFSQCVKGGMTCWHRSFKRRRQENKEGNQENKNWKSDIVFVGKYINGCKLGTNGDGQDYKTIKVDHNNF